MKRYFSVLSSIFFCAGLLAALGQGYSRFYGLTAVVPGGTNHIVGVAAIESVSNYPPYSAWIACPKSDNLCLYISYKLTGGTTNSGGSVFKFYRSADGSTVCSNSPISFVIYPNATGAAANNFVTNITMNGLPYLYMVPPANSNMYAMTNLYIGYGFKN